MNYIECKNLSLGYDNIPVIEDVSFVVEKGSYLCIVGENGVGKSTLIKTLLKLIKPISGEYITSPDLGSKDVGYLPQQTDVQMDFPATVTEIVLSGTIMNGPMKFFYSKDDKKLAEKNMERLDILDIKGKSYKYLSGGQKQRVLLARALCATEKVLLLDEPAAGLDPKVTAELYEIIKKLNKEGITIIMVTHDINATFEYASHVLHLGKKKKFFGTVEEYKNSEIGKAWATSV